MWFNVLVMELLEQGPEITGDQVGGGRSTTTSSPASLMELESSGNWFNWSRQQNVRISNSWEHPREVARVHERPTSSGAAAGGDPGGPAPRPGAGDSQGGG